MSGLNIELPLGKSYSDRFMLRNGLVTVTQKKYLQITQHNQHCVRYFVLSKEMYCVSRIL